MLGYENFIDVGIALSAFLSLTLAARQIFKHRSFFKETNNLQFNFHCFSLLKTHFSFPRTAPNP